MKFEVERKVIVKTKMDSSELVMFNKGGMHSVKLKVSDIFPETENEQEIEIQVQLDKNEQSRFNHVTNIQSDIDKKHAQTQQEKCCGKNFNIR